MNLMRGPKEEVVETVVEEKEEFGPLKPLGAPPAPLDDTGPPTLLPPATTREDIEKQENLQQTSRSSDDGGEAASEEGQEFAKEEQLTLQDLLGYVR